MADPNWITHAEAQRILGVHRSTVGKLIDRGKLDSRGFTGTGQGGLRREQVEALAAERRREAEQLERRRQERAYRRGLPQPPADGQIWLSVNETAAILGITGQSVRNKCRRDQIPSTLHDDRRWIRRDHLEIWLRARDARVRRQV